MTGHDVAHLAEQGLERMDDPDILAKARAESRIVVTFDLGFGELLAAAGSDQVPSVILFRQSNQTPAAVTLKLISALSRFEKALEKGAIVVVDDARYRLRRLPIEAETP